MTRRRKMTLFLLLPVFLYNDIYQREAFRAAMSEAFATLLRH